MKIEIKEMKTGKYNFKNTRLFKVNGVVVLTDGSVLAKVSNQKVYTHTALNLNDEAMKELQIFLDEEKRLLDSVEFKVEKKNTTLYLGGKQ